MIQKTNGVEGSMNHKGLIYHIETDCLTYMTFIDVIWDYSTSFDQSDHIICYNYILCMNKARARKCLK